MHVQDRPAGLVVKNTADGAANLEFDFCAGQIGQSAANGSLFRSCVAQVLVKKWLRPNAQKHERNYQALNSSLSNHKTADAIKY